MGRGKLPLRLIEKERARRITCMKRKKGLVKKAYELSTLCDVRVCMIIYDSADENSIVKTFPEDPHDVHRIIDDYRNYKIQNPSSSKRDLSLADFYNDRIKKLKSETEKLIHENRDDRDSLRDGRSISVWDSRIDDFTEDQLFELLVHLDQRIEEVNKLRADRTAMVVCETPHSNNCDHHHHQGQLFGDFQENNTMISSSTGVQSQAWFLDQPSSSSNAIMNPNSSTALIPSGFDQTMPFDHLMNPWTVMNNLSYYTNLLEAPDSYTLGMGLESSSANSNRTHAELTLQNMELPLSYGSSSCGQMQYFPGTEQFYHVQAPSPLVAMHVISPAKLHNQFYGGSQEDAKFYSDVNNNLGFGKASGV